MDKAWPIQITLENKLDKLGLINIANLLKNTEYNHIGISNCYNKTELENLKNYSDDTYMFKKCIDDTHMFKVRLVKG